MRENIGLYRGKRKDNGEWVVGYYVIESNHPCYANQLKHTPFICRSEFVDGGNGGVCDFVRYEVDPETVGEYSGLPDINGRIIFEGDIMETAVSGITQNIGVVEFKSGSFGLMCADGNGLFLCFVNDNFAVIGNVHDNPELLTNT